MREDQYMTFGFNQLKKILPLQENNHPFIHCSQCKKCKYPDILIIRANVLAIIEKNIVKWNHSWFDGHLRGNNSNKIFSKIGKIMI